MNTYCSNCKAEMEPGIKFCTECGEKIIQETNLQPSVNTPTIPPKNKRYTTMGIVLRICSVLSAIICLIAGLDMMSLRSISGTSVAEAYYQSVGVFVIGFSIFIGAFLWGFGCLIDNKILRKN